MEWLATISHFIQYEYMFITWRDTCEILFFAVSIYYFLLWLSQDKQNNLVFWFYGYCILTFGAHFAQLNNMSLVLFMASPLVFMFFIVVHQQTLQKNFIALKNITTKQEKNSLHWLEELMQTSLQNINKNKAILCIIERKSSIRQFLSTPYHFNATINHELLELLIDATGKSQQATLWINQSGKLVAINPSWKNHVDKTWVSDDVKAVHKWKQDAIFMTAKTDALIFYLSPTTRLFDIIIEGKTINQINAGQAFTLLKKYNGLLYKKDHNYAHFPTKNFSKQKLN